MVARQAITHALVAWVESPLDSQHLFCIIRVMQRYCGRVKKARLLGGEMPLCAPNFWVQF
jgi:hypothetical protein